MKKYTAEEAKKLYIPGMGWGCYRHDREPDEAYNVNSRPSFNMSSLDYYYTLDISEKDVINEPPHYIINIEGKEFDCRAVQKALGMYEHHCLASAFAYLWRSLHKDNYVGDIEKAINFLKEELEYQRSKK